MASKKSASGVRPASEARVRRRGVKEGLRLKDLDAKNAQKVRGGDLIKHK